MNLSEIIDDKKHMRYQNALDRLSSVDLDFVLDKLGYEVANQISTYGIHDYPNLEMQGDLNLLQECLDKLVLLEKLFDKACECLDEYQYIYEHELVTGHNMLSFSSKEDWEAFVLEEVMEEEEE